MMAAAAGQSPDAYQLTRFQEKIRQDIAGIPNYTCVETIDRARRDAHSRTFKPIDTVRLEVSTVAGRELFAKPGASRFEDRGVASLVSGGVIGTGTFAMFARDLFIDGKGTLRYAREEKLDGRRAVRYDFHIPRPDSNLRLEVRDSSERVAAKGSFWFDPVSLDLMRLDVFAVDIPEDFRLREASTSTDYARSRIGASDVLMPNRSELTMTHALRFTYRDVIGFSQCREYGAASTVKFDQ